MKANELRIGNWVAHEPTIDDWEEIIVRPGTIIQCEISPDSFMPIRVTEEWLLKFGFEICGYNQLFWRHTELIKNFELGGINWADADYPEYQFLTYGFNNEIFSIHYVHQLQNLYFALTGEELTLIK